MDATVAATVIGVLLSVSSAAYAMAFARLRSDMHAGFDRLDARFERLDTRFGHLEARFDDLILAFGRSGEPTEPSDSDADH